MVNHTKHREWLCQRHPSSEPESDSSDCLTSAHLEWGRLGEMSILEPFGKQLRTHVKLCGSRTIPSPAHHCLYYCTTFPRGDPHIPKSRERYFKILQHPMTFDFPTVWFKYGDDTCGFPSLDGRIKRKDVARAFGLSAVDLCIEGDGLLVDDEGYFEYCFPVLPAFEGATPEAKPHAQNVTVMKLLSWFGSFPEVCNIREVVKSLETIGLEGNLLKKEPIPFNIRSQREATHGICEQLLTSMQDKGSPHRHHSNLIFLEAGLGGGKTHAAATLKDNLGEAIEEALRKARSPVAAGYVVHTQLRAAFQDDGGRQGRVATISLEFDGDDRPSDRDVKADESVFLGLRLFSRGFLGVSVKRLRSVLPPQLERALTAEAVWPLVCARLRHLHGLAPFTPEHAADPEQWLVLLLTLDEIQRIQTFLESVGKARHMAANFCHDVSMKVGELVYTETTSPVSPSAECGVVLQPVLLSTCSWAYDWRLLSLLQWKHIALQPLDFSQSKELMKHTLLSEPAYIQLLPAKAERVSFFERLLGTTEMQGALEMGGGVPGVLTAGAQALTSAAVLPMIESLINNSVWEEACVSDLAIGWTSTWAEISKERFFYSNLIDTLGVAAAKELLLLVLSGNPVWQTQKLSGCTLSDALASGAFYVNDYGHGYCSITLPAIVLQLFYDALSTRPGPAVFCEAEREAITQLMKPQVKSHRDKTGEPFEVMVAAQLLITAACWRALGESVVTIGCLFRAAREGIRGGFLSPDLEYVAVELHDTMRILMSRTNVKSSNIRHGASQLNPWLKVERPPCAPSASLLDPGYAVLVDSWSDCAVQPIAKVGVRAAYKTPPSKPPILLLLNLLLREGAHKKSSWLTTVRSSYESFSSEEAELPFEALYGLITPGKIDKAAFQAATASEKPLLIISAEACVSFIPVLRHRPILRGACAAASNFDAKDLQKVMAAVDRVWGP